MSMQEQPSTSGWMSKFEGVVFKNRKLILFLLLALTLVSFWRASEVHIDAGFEKQLPSGHPFIETFFEYREQLPGPNGIIVAIESPTGDIWNKEFLETLYHITDELFYVPGVFRTSVTSFWTPNLRILEIDEEGIHAHKLIPGTVTAENLTPEMIEDIREDAQNAGLIGKLTSYDSSAALIRLELMEVEPFTGEPLDYAAAAERLEAVRAKFEAQGAKVHIIGFAKLVGEITNATLNVVFFFFVSFLLTAVALWIYIRHLGLTLLAVGCSAISVVWQFGIMEMLGYGLDPMAILVPFLVYAIGVSHGIQQINLLSRTVAEGATPYEAARYTFRHLFAPGGMAILTDLVGFLLLLLIAIPMVQEIAVIAALGIALKLIANLILLPLLAPYFKFSDTFKERHTRLLERRSQSFKRFAILTRPKVAYAITLITIVVIAASAYATRDRQVGDLHAGAPQLHHDALYNQDWRYITSNFRINLDTFVVILETPNDACIDGDIMEKVARFTHFMDVQPEVVSAVSLSTVAAQGYVLWQEGNLKWRHVPRNKYTLVLTTSYVSPSTGLLNRTCTILPVIAFTKDHRAETINSLVAKTQAYIDQTNDPQITYRLASGNVGIIAATNEVIAAAELPMLLVVFLVIAALVYLVNRDWRAVIACCLPLMLATILGYGLMIFLEIGLTIATLPVLILSVGIGVDYALYIYNQMQPDLDAGVEASVAVSSAMEKTGAAVIFTGLILGLGVATWAFSDLKFQADMGLLLSFMFIANMIVAITVLPALTSILYRNQKHKRQAE